MYLNMLEAAEEFPELDAVTFAEVAKRGHFGTPIRDQYGMLAYSKTKILEVLNSDGEIDLTKTVHHLLPAGSIRLVSKQTSQKDTKHMATFIKPTVQTKVLKNNDRGWAGINSDTDYEAKALYMGARQAKKEMASALVARKRRKMAIAGGAVPLTSPALTALIDNPGSVKLNPADSGAIKLK